MDSQKVESAEPAATPASTSGEVAGSEATTQQNGAAAPAKVDTEPDSEQAGDTAQKQVDRNRPPVEPFTKKEDLPHLKSVTNESGETTQEPSTHTIRLIQKNMYQLQKEGRRSEASQVLERCVEWFGESVRERIFSPSFQPRMRIAYKTYCEENGIPVPEEYQDPPEPEPEPEPEPVATPLIPEINMTQSDAVMDISDTFSVDSAAHWIEMRKEWVTNPEDTAPIADWNDLPEMQRVKRGGIYVLMPTKHTIRFIQKNMWQLQRSGRRVDALDVLDRVDQWFGDDIRQRVMTDNFSERLRSAYVDYCEDHFLPVPEEFKIAKPPSAKEDIVVAAQWASDDSDDGGFDENPSETGDPVKKEDIGGPVSAQKPSAKNTGGIRRSKAFKSIPAFIGGSLAACSDNRDTIEDIVARRVQKSFSSSQYTISAMEKGRNPFSVTDLFTETNFSRETVEKILTPQLKTLLDYFKENWGLPEIPEDMKKLESIERTTNADGEQDATKCYLFFKKMQVPYGDSTVKVITKIEDLPGMKETRNEDGIMVKLPSKETVRAIQKNVYQLQRHGDPDTAKEVLSRCGEWFGKEFRQRYLTDSFMARMRRAYIEYCNDHNVPVPDEYTDGSMDGDAEMAARRKNVNDLIHNSGRATIPQNPDGKPNTETVDFLRRIVLDTVKLGINTESVILRVRSMFSEKFVRQLFADTDFNENMRQAMKQSSVKDVKEKLSSDASEEEIERLAGEVPMPDWFTKYVREWKPPAPGAAPDSGGWFGSEPTPLCQLAPEPVSLLAVRPVLRPPRRVAPGFMGRGVAPRAPRPAYPMPSAAYPAPSPAYPTPGTAYPTPLHSLPLGWRDMDVGYSDAGYSQPWSHQPGGYHPAMFAGGRPRGLPPPSGGYAKRRRMF